MDSPLTISYQSSQWDLIIELVSSKLGIALLPRSIYYKQTNSNVKIVPIENQPSIGNLELLQKKKPIILCIKRIIENAREKMDIQQ